MPLNDCLNNSFKVNCCFILIRNTDTQIHKQISACMYVCAQYTPSEEMKGMAHCW